MDINTARIDMLKAGQMPIHEPELEAIVKRNCAAGRLLFSTDYGVATAHAEVIFIAVGTPSDEDGSASLSHMLSVARSIGRHMPRPLVVVDKSTVPVGTADAMRSAIAQELLNRGIDIPFEVVSNPEFLKEGAAVDDFMRPDRIIIGTDSARASALMRQLYQPFNRNHERLIEMDARSAELSKYAANAILATRISFMNELANLAEVLGADIEAVRHGIGTDSRIGPHFLYAGMGYGGSCFPKDVKALLKTADHHEMPLQILSAVQAVNDAQKNVMYQKICQHFGGVGQLKGVTIGIWGLSFKPNTDDLREAPSLVLIRRLLASGCRVKAYDPVVRTIRLSGNDAETEDDLLQLVDTPWDAVHGADGLALVTEWQEFRSPDFERLARNLARKVLFDGRNLYDPLLVQRAGLTYHGIGRPGTGGIQ
jgi:UDPglucose 6-dehydrogenase